MRAAQESQHFIIRFETHASKARRTERAVAPPRSKAAVLAMMACSSKTRTTHALIFRKPSGPDLLTAFGRTTSKPCAQHP
jgi:hypothetical protein